MENNKPRKISFTILSFFYNFLHIFEALLKKKKEKNSNSDGSYLAQRPSSREKGARAPARWRLCKKGPEFLSNSKRSHSLIRCVADRSQKGPCVSSYSQLEVLDGARAEDELR
jgi:hypothetical protein